MEIRKNKKRKCENSQAGSARTPEKIRLFRRAAIAWRARFSAGPGGRSHFRRRAQQARANRGRCAGGGSNSVRQKKWAATRHNKKIVRQLGSGALFRPSGAKYLAAPPPPLGSRWHGRWCGGGPTPPPIGRCGRLPSRNTHPACPGGGGCNRGSGGWRAPRERHRRREVSSEVPSKPPNCPNGRGQERVGASCRRRGRGRR